MATLNRYPIFAALDEEWRRFIRSPEASEAADRWKHVEPELGDLRTVDDVLAARMDPCRADGVLRALVARASWDVEAARVVLQALIPGLVRLASRFADDDPDAAAGDVVAIAWERICSYPVHRRGQVAPNLLFDIRKQLVADRQPLDDLTWQVDAPSAEDEALEGLLFDELRAAEVAEMGTDEHFELVLASRVHGFPMPSIAEATGVSRHGLVQRRRRTERRLRKHLTAA